MTLPLKAIPFVNGDNEPLMICEQCGGSGIVTVSEKEQHNKKTDRTFKQGEKLSADVIRAFQKNGWGVRKHECLGCKGAGIRKKLGNKQ